MKNFKDAALLDLALTHRSWVNEHKGVRSSNERLEFLGDAVLEFVVSKELYKKFPGEEEGYLTALRANLVNTVSLAGVAKKLDLGPLLNLSKGEEESGGRANPSLLADTVEAIIGAIFIDRGILDAEKFITESLLVETEKRASEPLKDPKSLLQEHVQSKSFPAPKYQVVEENGPDHDKKFVVEVIVSGQVWGRGEGKSKSVAEQEAAKNALAKASDEKV
ncbi:MAG: Ribonuclease 3 [Candidatus Woesebacteria bacterium GW2011_GWA2_40_7b]|uniref:Ribonuclease 3 n=1 Tax=Candidatus Woesebacteria bacterium GW2011_GWA2_40_7b TaxID=1618563 RepID=A0A0G0SY10_9BACT|nr:MAG: Ribonuclease 3 [Candidatus Woesebacteria bacterium GW2011_GWA2_40_7b]